MQKLIFDLWFLHPLCLPHTHTLTLMVPLIYKASPLHTAYTVEAFTTRIKDS